MRTALCSSLLPLLAVAVLGAPLVAQEPVPAPGDVRVELATGEILIGTLLEWEGNELVLDHPRFGRLVIPKIDLLHPNQLPGPAGKPGEIVVPLPPPAPPAPPPAWTGLADIGLTGSNGNTNEQDFRASLRAEHKTDDLIKNIYLNFERDEAESVTTKKKGYAEGRLTWPEPDSPWRTFVQATYEVDRFAAYDSRKSVAVGRGYAFEDTAETFLEGRFGVGVSQEEGEAVDEDVIPELVIGGDYRHNFSPTRAVTATVDFYPSLKDSGEYRAIARAAWEQKLEETSPWVFRFGGEDKYDSQNGAGVNHDLTYFLSLGYNF